MDIVHSMESSLEMLVITNKTGYIQTPGFDSKLFPPPVDSWVTVAALPHHVILLSFLFINRCDACPEIFCQGMTNTVRLYKGGKSEGDLVWKTCGFTVPAPEVYDDKMLHVRFVSVRTAERPEFRLRYTFIKDTQRPTRAPAGGLWNCSVPGWREFQGHFLCNLEKECEGGEDEAPCFYTGHCGQGFLTLENRCYKYIHRTSEYSSWRLMNLDCETRGGYLASLNTPAEWKAAVAALRTRVSTIKILMGLRDGSSVMPIMYTRIMVWADQTVAYFVNCTDNLRSSCSYFSEDLKYASSLSKSLKCDNLAAQKEYLCEFTPARHSEDSFVDLHRQLVFRGNDSQKVKVVKCPAGHFTHTFLACDERSSCWLDRRASPQRDDRGRGIPSRASCPAPLTSLPAMFACAEGDGSGLRRVPYSMVCDHRQQCADSSDESFCIFPGCSEATPMQCGTSAQSPFVNGYNAFPLDEIYNTISCVSVSAMCNRQQDCIQGDDETHCLIRSERSINTRPPPAVVHFDPRPSADGWHDYSPFFTTPLPRSSDQPGADPCPDTHFLCPNSYCIPVFLRCNSINDCPGRVDEAGCDRAVLCPGFYRCRSSGVCLHPDHMCDGVYQCPQQDDEIFCSVICPGECTCHGLDFACHRRPFPAELYPNVRYLDASRSGMSLARLRENTFLVHLDLSSCGLGRLDVVALPNLRSLDLSCNELYAISTDHLRGMTILQFLSLAHNRLKSLFSPHTDQDHVLHSVQSLDLSGVWTPRLDTHSFAVFPALRTLNLSHCGIRYVTGGSLGEVVKDLQVLDAVGCSMTQFPRDLMSRLNQLRSIRVDNFKLCCPATLPPAFNLANCQAPVDEVSSCESLLRSRVYRTMLPVFASLALLGNFGCLLVRSCCLKSSLAGFSVFVSHLSVSDFLMGVYLAVIGLADRLYLDSYLWDDISWRHSTACRTAGFLSLLSNEVSALIICLITLDRFLVLRFPFSSSLHFRTRSAHVVCGVVWVVAVVLAGIPLTPPLTSHWSFYSQTGICIPLPVTRRDFAGRHYSFSIFVVLNFILFLLIAVGQAAIYASIQSNTIPLADSTKKSNDLRIARRLFTVVMSDFLCWFPIGLLGLMASSGIPVPGEVNVGVAILVLPLNSAINPFLYTLNILIERSERLRYQKLLKKLEECRN